MNIYDKTITILNKLSAKDSATKLDVYYKTVLHNCCGWYEKTVADVQGQTVSVGSIIRVLIPFKTKSNNALYINNNLFPKDLIPVKYLPYRDWKRVGNQDNAFTISKNDVIILGEVTEDVTSKNLTSIKHDYEPSVCEVRSFKVHEKRIVDQCIELVIEGV